MQATALGIRQGRKWSLPEPVSYLAVARWPLGSLGAETRLFCLPSSGPCPTLPYKIFPQLLLFYKILFSASFLLYPSGFFGVDISWYQVSTFRHGNLIRPPQSRQSTPTWLRPPRDRRHKLIKQALKSLKTSSSYSTMYHT